MLSDMLHDGMMSRPPTGRSAVPGRPRPMSDTACDDRRASDRVPFPAELVVVWNHDLKTPLRFRVIDAGDGGYRIRSSMPLLEGTTGMVLRLLPGRGQALDQPVMVAWSHAADDGGYDVGLRVF